MNKTVTKIDINVGNGRSVFEISYFVSLFTCLSMICFVFKHETKQTYKKGYCNVDGVDFIVACIHIFDRGHKCKNRRGVKSPGVFLFIY